MLRHSKQFLTENDDTLVGPNAVDIPLNRLFQVAIHLEFTLLKTGKRVTEPTEVNPNFGTSDHPCWQLLPNRTYLFESDVPVNLPDGVAGWVVGRSTLLRNGIHVLSALYDAGFYSTSIGGAIFAHRPALIEKGARIGQFITIDAETSHLYQGQYQGKTTSEVA